MKKKATLTSKDKHIENTVYILYSVGYMVTMYSLWSAL